MPAHHDDDCDCAGCLADVDRFWREQEGEPDPDMPPDTYEFDVADLDDVTPLPPAPVPPRHAMSSRVPARRSRAKRRR